MGRTMNPARILLAAMALLAVAYGSDYLWLRYRILNPMMGDAFGSVIYYDSTTTKNGKVEVFFDQPQTEMCVHSIFPHLGDRPCWYASRRTVKSID
jgi:hypothetical protein